VNGPTTVYEAAGGEETFSRLIERFYAGVAQDPALRPLYPADPEMFAAAGEHLRLFLIQYWGGPGTYSERRGHPRLRMRHAPFSIGRAERDAWMGHMRTAVGSLDLPPAVRDAFLDYFENAATAMMNRGGPPF
jgi:hemoglobin